LGSIVSENRNTQDNQYERQTDNRPLFHHFPPSMIANRNRLRS
jgi:hypothetical protein